MNENLIFDPSYNVYDYNGEVQNVFINLDLCKDDGFHKEIIDRFIVKYLTRNNSNESIINILIELPTWYSSRRTIKKYLCEKFNKTHTNGGANLFESLIIRSVNQFKEDLRILKVFKTKQCIKILNFIYVYIQIFNKDCQFEFLIDNVFDWYLNLMTIFATQSEGIKYNSNSDEDNTCILNYVLQHQLIVLTKSKSPLLIDKSVVLIEIVHKTLTEPLLKFEMVAKGTLLLAHVFRNLPLEERLKNIKNTDHPMLDYIDEEGPINVSNFTLPNIFISDEMKLALYCSVLNSVEDGTVLESRHDLYKNLIQFGNLMTGYPEKINLISRTLTSVSGHFQNLNLFEIIFPSLLSFTWAHLEHFVESVRHSTKDLLHQIVEIVFKLHKNNPKSQFLQILLDEIQSMPSTNSVRLIATGFVCEVQFQYEIDVIPNLQHYLILALSDCGLSQQAGDLYVQLLARNSKKHDGKEFFKTWIKPLVVIMEKVDCYSASIIQKVITSGFLYKPEIIQYSFSSSLLSNSYQLLTFLKCINLSRNKGITLDLGTDLEDDSSYWRRFIPKKTLTALMTHQKDDIRILTLQVVVECQKSTEEILDWELVFLTDFFIFNASNQVPSTRKKIGSLYKKLFIRLDASRKSIIKRLSNDNDFKNRYDSYGKFINNFITVLLNNLVPDSNYPRRSLSLELLLILNKFTPNHEWLVCFSDIQVTNLKNIILFDNYENNKLMAVVNLKTLPFQLLGYENEEVTMSNLHGYLTAACDVSPNCTLSASYMLQIILLSPHFPIKSGDARFDTLIMLKTKLEDLFRISCEDIVTSAKTASLHGLVLSMKTLLQGRDLNQNNLYTDFCNDLTLLCLEIKQHISPIVCNASPEGHIPEYDVTICDTDYTSKAQMVLVYAWRTMKEIMLLFAELAKQTVTLERAVVLVTDANLINIGNFFIDVFVQTKHRGVFEQAGVAFSMICKEFWRSNNKIINCLPNEWLQLAVALCTGKTNDNRLCSTRRSAGLPFLILSIVSTGLESMSVDFHRTVEELVDVASNTDPENDEFRTHSLNVLRYIFINSKLGDFVPIFVDRAVIAAIEGFKSKIWGVRNSSTLLFSALITRIFGVQRTQHSDNVPPKNRLTLATFNLRYPKLLTFLLETLKEECDQHDSQVVHPILIILARLYPSHTDNINDKVGNYIRFMDKCVSNPAFSTRELSARASISLIGLEKSKNSLNTLFGKISSVNIREAECHGTLLQISHLLKTSNKLNCHNFNSTYHLLTGNYSDTIVSSYMEVLASILMRFPSSSGDLESLKTVFSLVSKAKPRMVTTCKSGFDWNRLKLMLIILLGKFDVNECTFDVVNRELLIGLLNSNSKFKTSCLHFLNGLNQQVEHGQEEHPLYMGCLNIPPYIYDLMQYLDDKCKKSILLNTHADLKRFLIGEVDLLHTSRDHLICSDENLLILLLQTHYPCAFAEERDCPQKVINFFLDFCHVACNEEIVSASLSCLVSFLATYEKSVLATLDLDEFFRVLVSSSSPVSSDFLRLTVTQSLVILNRFFRGDDSSILNYVNQLNVFNLIMVLLEDEEIEVRKTISRFEIIANRVLTSSRKDSDTFPITAEKARYDLMTNISGVLSRNQTISFLISWGCRELSGTSKDVSEVYERGELNQFAENVPITLTAGKILRKILILDEESNQKAAHEMITSLECCRPSMMSDSTRKYLIEELQRIVGVVGPLDNIGVQNHNFNTILKIIFDIQQCELEL